MLGVRWGLRWRELSEGVVLMFKFVYERSIVSMSFLFDGVECFGCYGFGVCFVWL